MNTTIAIMRVHPDGNIQCVYTEALDLLALGRLRIQRVSSIEFDHETQAWQVRDLQGGLLHSCSSRVECLRWESDQLTNALLEGESLFEQYPPKRGAEPKDKV